MKKRDNEIAGVNSSLINLCYIDLRLTYIFEIYVETKNDSQMHTEEMEERERERFIK